MTDGQREGERGREGGRTGGAELALAFAFQAPGRRAGGWLAEDSPGAIQSIYKYADVGRIMVHGTPLDLIRDATQAATRLALVHLSATSYQ